MTLKPRERATWSHVPPPWLAVWRQGSIYVTVVYEASPGCRSAPGWAAGTGIGVRRLWGASVVGWPPPWVRQCRGGWSLLSGEGEGAGGQGSSAGGAHGRLKQAGCWRHHKWAWDRVREGLWMGRREMWECLLWRVVKLTCSLPYTEADSPDLQNMEVTKCDSEI